MPRFLAAFTVSLLTIALTPLHARAQDATEQEKRIAWAMTVVDDALVAASSLRLAQNRVTLRLAAFNVLWGRDRDRAKQVVADITTDLVAFGAETEDGDWREASNRRSQIINLRQQVMSELLQRDPLLALDFLAKTRPPADQSRPNGYDPEAELQLQLASAVAAVDAKKALEVAEATLERGLSYSLASFIQQLEQKDPAAAARFATSVYAKIKTSQIMTDQVALSLACFLIRDSLDGEASADRKPLLSADDEAALEQLVFTSVLSLDTSKFSSVEVARSQSFVSQISVLIEPLSRRSPALAAKLKQKVDDQARLVSRFYGTRSGPDYQNSSPDEILEAASKASDETRGSLYLLAAQKATSSGDVDRARSIINTGVKDPMERGQWLDNLDRQAFYNALSSQHYDDARAILAKFARPAERVALLVQIAQQLQKPEDVALRNQLIGEADTLAGERPGDAEMFQARIAVAQAYAEIDPPRAFAIIEASVDQLNTLLDAASIMDGFNCERQYDGGELLLAQGGSLINYVMQCASTLGTISSQDLERSSNDAGRFARGEARALALLTVARSVLETPAAPVDSGNVADDGEDE